MQQIAELQDLMRKGKYDILKRRKKTIHDFVQGRLKITREINILYPTSRQYDVAFAEQAVHLNCAERKDKIGAHRWIT